MQIRAVVKNDIHRGTVDVPIVVAARPRPDAVNEARQLCLRQAGTVDVKVERVRRVVIIVAAITVIRVVNRSNECYLILRQDTNEYAGVMILIITARLRRKSCACYSHTVTTVFLCSHNPEKQVLKMISSFIQDLTALHFSR
jgi:hypothetical protein